jgi:hypothetical protein
VDDYADGCHQSFPSDLSTAVKKETGLPGLLRHVQLEVLLVTFWLVRLQAKPHRMSGGGHSRHHASNLPRRFSKTQLEVPLFDEDGAGGTVAVGAIRRDRDDCVAAP